MVDGNVDSGATNLNLTPEERRVFGQLFREADTENIGVVTGEVAVKFFEKTRLEPRILGEIWQIADKENRGLLTPAGFGIVLRLIGHYQAGRDPTPELAFRPGPLPKFDGGLPGTIQPPPGPPPGATIQPPNSANLIRVPPLTPDKVAQYASLFEKSGAQDGILPGEQAKQIFERAGLPNETLGKIWNLADIEQRGALNVTEFIVAMHLLASSKSGALRALPNTLPPGLYEAAARRPPPRQLSGVSSGTPAVPPIPRQFSGAAGRTASPLARPSYPGAVSSQPTGLGNWAITPADKARFDSIYVTLDKTNRGFITGDEAVPFFSNSKLSEEVLAQIWDLADINSQGQLTKDEFAVAMYLIRQQRGKRDGRDTLPATLPADLVPPSMRNQVRQAPPPTAPAFEAAAPVIPKSAADDLFGLDALTSSPPPAPVQQPLSTGGSNFTDPFTSNRTPGSPTRSSPAPIVPQTTGFKPFVPSSSFGQTLAFNATGSSSASAPQPRAAAQRSAAMDDLLGDNDPEISKKLTSETTELANLSNQVGTLSTQMQEVQAHRSNAQNQLNQANSQKQEFEARLAQLRTLYEKEAKDVRSLEERLNTSRNETKKLQQEIAMVEGTHQDLQNQHQQIVTALQADQQENASLKERIRVLNTEIAQLKPQLEKLRFEARQQKGLVAINKKQLLTNEGERDKLKTEAEELNKSIEEDTKALAASALASSQAQSPAAAVSPASSSSNPFFRRQGSTSEVSFSPFPSPPAQQQPGNSFENIFGPTYEAAVNTALPTTPMPPTTFRQSPELQEKVSPPARELSASPPSDSAIPPPPAQSRQISSSFLPFPQADNESITSSRQVSAPASRFGDSLGSTETSKNAQLTPTGSSAADAQDNQLASSTTLERHITASSVTSETRSTASVKDAMPGAFPSDVQSGGSGFSDSDTFAPKRDLPKSVASKDDFDAAFAGLGGKASSQGGEKKAEPTTSRFNQEFPPVEELENDEDSSSASEGGFDDDFAPGGHSRNQSLAAPATSSLSVPTESGPNLSRASSGVTVGGKPPAEDAQSSPPLYDKAVSSHERAEAEVAEFKGLIPSREDPTSPEVPYSVPSGTSGQSLFSQATPAAQPAPPPKTAFDDFDDFDDLEEAKEGELDDEFSNISVHDRSGLDDFNPMFDSPANSKTTGQDSAFGSSSGFGDFTQSPVASQTAAAPAPSTDSNDWDAIFAGLDGPQHTAPTLSASDENKKASVDEAFGSGPAPKEQRPQLGRALTEGGEHDDPILKNLTGMGYPRKAALAALEKYDYNLERAANYLANES